MVLDDVARRQVTVFVVIGVLCVVAIALLYGVGVHTHWVRDLEEVADQGRSVVKPTATQASERLLRTISRTPLALLGGALLLTALLRRRPRLALAVGVALGGAVLSAEALEREILDRPVDPSIEGITINGSPSGHATIGM